MKLFMIQELVHGTLQPPVLFVDEGQAREHYLNAVKTRCGEDFASRHAKGGFVMSDNFLVCNHSKYPTGVHRWSCDLGDVSMPAGHRLFALPELNTALPRIDSQQGMLEHFIDEVQLDSYEEEVVGWTQGILDSIAKQASPAHETVDDSNAPIPSGWEAYVESIRQKFAEKGECSFFPKSDWQYEVQNGNTSRSYWDWLAVNMEQAIDEAKAFGYDVSPDLDQAEKFHFVTPAHEKSSASYNTEEEAWHEALKHATE